MDRKPRLSWWDRFLIGIAPDWGLRRVRAREQARHFEAAQGGRRTDGWTRRSSDANAANAPALVALRELSRDLCRNNGWAENGIRTIAGNTIGWGILPRPVGTGAARARVVWADWAGSTSCDFDGMLTFTGLQLLAMRALAESGEVLIVKQPASTADGLPVPLRLQVLEPDYIDTTRNGLPAANGGQIIDGIEIDAQGHRVAYWLFASHPGANRLANPRLDSQRIEAERVLHLYRVDRPGQVRGVPWLATAIAKLKDLDDFEDAELIQQKVAACFGAFVTDVDGSGAPLSPTKTGDDGVGIEQLEPGHIAYLPPGKSVEFATPPLVQNGGLSTRSLRRIAVSLGVTYEDLTGDYSLVNFSSGRMGRLAVQARVQEWRWQMIVPRLCAPVWRWVMSMAAELEGWPAIPRAEWSAPPMPILEPDKEGLAYQRMIRTGLMTWEQAVRELGEDPTAQLDEIERANREFDRRGIILDVDPRKTTATGQQQLSAGAGPAKPGAPAKPGSAPGTDKPDDQDTDEQQDTKAPESPASAPDPKADDDATGAPDADDDETDGKTDKAKPTPPGKSTPPEVRVFAYHQPFMKVKEIRAGIALTESVPDEDLFSGEFLAKHGGPDSGGESAE